MIWDCFYVYMLVIEPGTPQTPVCASPALSHYSYTFDPLPCQLGQLPPWSDLASGSSYFLPKFWAFSALGKCLLPGWFPLILLFRFTLWPLQQRTYLVMMTACGEQEPREEIQKEYQKPPLSLSALLTQGCPAVPGVGEYLSEGQLRSPQSWYATCLTLKG